MALAAKISVEFLYAMNQHKQKIATYFGMPPKKRSMQFIVGSSMHFLIIFSLIMLSPNLMSTNSSETNFCKTLHAAVRENNSAMVGLVVKASGADCRDEQGRTALHIWAEVGGSWLIYMDLLIRGSATIDAVTNDGTTPFHMAVMCQKLDHMMMLAFGGLPFNKADVNARTNNGFTALHIAVLNKCSPQIVAKLLAIGVNPETVDEEGRTARVLAEALANKELTQMLSNDGFVDVSL